MLSHVLLFWDPRDWKPPGSSVHETFQARIPEQVAIPFSRGSSQSKDGTRVSCLGRWILNLWATSKVKVKVTSCPTLWDPMDFSRLEHWSGQPFPSPGDIPNPGIEPKSPVLQANSLPSEPPGKPQLVSTDSFISSTLPYKQPQQDTPVLLQY